MDLACKFLIHTFAFGIRLHGIYRWIWGEETFSQYWVFPLKKVFPFFKSYFLIWNKNGISFYFSFHVMSLSRFYLPTLLKHRHTAFPTINTLHLSVIFITSNKTTLTLFLIIQKPWYTSRLAVGALHSTSLDKCIMTWDYYHGTTLNSWGALKIL